MFPAYSPCGVLAGNADVICDKAVQDQEDREGTGTVQPAKLHLCHSKTESTAQPPLPLSQLAPGIAPQPPVHGVPPQVPPQD